MDTTHLKQATLSFHEFVSGSLLINRFLGLIVSTVENLGLRNALDVSTQRSWCQVICAQQTKVLELISATRCIFSDWLRARTSLARIDRCLPDSDSTYKLCVPVWTRPELNCLKRIDEVLSVDVSSGHTVW
ncbi:unnamed protein product [Dicrocoelium dendriticum]|nr:unnamed protein product [Dicrocoelium dendriticum]